METKEQRYYHSLYEVAAALNSARAPEAILESIVKEVAKTLGGKGCSLMLLSPDKKILLHTTAYGLSDWFLRKGPVSVDKSLAPVLDDQPVSIFDVATDERVQYPEQARKEGIASHLSVPMRLRHEVIGVVRVYSSEPRRFSPEDVFFVGAVAHLGAIALENARLYEAVQKDYDAFRLDTLEWRAAMGHEWLVEKSAVPPEEEGQEKIG